MKPCLCSLLALLLGLGALPCPVLAQEEKEPVEAVPFLQVVEPQVQRAEKFSLVTPDRHVATLGQVDRIIDWAAQHDSLKQHEIREAGLKLADGRPIEAFAFDENAGLIVAAAAPVKAITLTGVQQGADGNREILVTFYDPANWVIAPPAGDVAVFTLEGHERLALEYTPMTPPGRIELPVDLLLDSSGSMDGYMDQVLAAARAFVTALPAFTGCRIRTFNNEILDLTPVAAKPFSCPDTAGYLDGEPIQAGGGTALYQAVQESLGRGDGAAGSAAIAQLTIVVTDGMDTAGGVSLSELVRAKRAAPKSKVLVFWAGGHDPSYLEGVADFELVSMQDLDAELAAFFTSINVTVRGMQTLRVPGPV